MCRGHRCSDEEPVLLAGMYRATMLLHDPGARMTSISIYTFSLVEL